MLLHKSSSDDDETNMNAGVQTFPLRRRCGILALRPGALGKEVNNGTAILYLNFAFSSREHGKEAQRNS